VSGERKLELYADDFIALIREFADSHERSPLLTDTAEESVNLFKVGYSIEKIAEQRGIKTNTVYTHLIQGIEESVLELKDVITLSDQELQTIQDEILSVPDEQNYALKPVYESLNEAYSYDVLRCVKASMKL